jgi:Iron-containing redox enzyme
LYYYLVNIEEHPEMLPLAFDLVEQRLNAAAGLANDALTPPRTSSQAVEFLDKILGHLSESNARFSRPWQASEDLTKRRTLHYFIQFLPMALVDGCWLQGSVRVSTSYTPLGASLTELYRHQVRGLGRHFSEEYRTIYARLISPLEEPSSRSFVDRADFSDTSFLLPIFLLSIGQFTRSFSAELLGVNLAWQFLGLSAFGPDLIRDVCASHGLPLPGDDFGAPLYCEKGREMARDAAAQLLMDADDSALADAWKRLMCGINVGVGIWTEWFDRVSETSPTGPRNPRQEMIDMLRRKSAHAFGYHADKHLGAKRIDELLDPKTFDGDALLAALAGSPWVKPGDPNRSILLKRLVSFGGPMLAVFSTAELQIIENWIDSLPAKGASSVASEATVKSVGTPAPSQPTVKTEAYVSGSVWTPADFRRRSEDTYSGFSVRELYHYLVNLEFHSDILPIAERFACDRLERSMAMLWNGERPIPSRRYDPSALERWVHEKHRQQVESYRTPEQRPDVSKDAFIEATVQLAPLILIDGGWLQGMASPALIHTTVGRMLFHVLVEELGEGKPKEHHANIYRDLLAKMGVNPAPVDTWEFAKWSRLDDSSFDVPTLWLTISCFPRHFLPEILGLNLAVELAGIGGPYMEARDTLRQFGYPSLFVDVHNAADNVSVGHSAWAMNAIIRYMDEVAEREGPHSLDHTWHRVWSGVRATLPQIGRVRLLAHRIGERFFLKSPTLIPRIFPS